jgi:hypothetical protein
LLEIEASERSGALVFGGVSNVGQTAADRCATDVKAARALSVARRALRGRSTSGQ